MNSLMSYAAVRSATDGFSQQHVIGEGSFGLVYRARLLSGQTVAAKRLDTTNKRGRPHFNNEVEILTTIQSVSPTHANIIRLICAYVTPEPVIVLEHMPKGTLSAALYSPGLIGSAPLRWKIRDEVIAGICSGVKFLHGCGVIHRDLKTSNVLLDDQMRPKIADFGLAAVLSRGAELEKWEGTPG
jgi:serine/threonine protein kinase